MREIIKKTLEKLKQDFGKEIFSNPRRVKAALKDLDLGPDTKRIRFLLNTAFIEMRIINRLESEQIKSEFLIDILANEMASDYITDIKLAHTVIESIVDILEYKFHFKLKITQLDTITYDNENNYGIDTNQSTKFVNFKKNWKIGETGPAGGTIFYDKGNNKSGWRFLEVAPESHEFVAEWGANGINITNTSISIGSGRENTISIKQFLETIGEYEKAAQKCLSLDINGFTDWFLPSKNELELIYINVYKKKRNRKEEYSNTRKSNNSVYWSSSQSNDYNAWYQHFYIGYQHFGAKNNIIKVIACRSFE